MRVEFAASGLTSFAGLELGTGLRWGYLCAVEAKHLKRNPDGWFLEIVVFAVS